MLTKNSTICTEPAPGKSLMIALSFKCWYVKPFQHAGTWPMDGTQTDGQNCCI